MCFLHFNKRADSARKNEEVLIIIQSLHLKMTIYGYCRQSKNYIGLKIVNKSINKKNFYNSRPNVITAADWPKFINTDLILCLYSDPEN